MVERLLLSKESASASCLSQLFYCVVLDLADLKALTTIRRIIQWNSLTLVLWINNGQ